MSVRQYIGARYVPIFFDNNGSTEWVANHIYEPLTIVTYLGNSYTSKKLVTADIGNPASNSEYWASTGIYNSQVEQYREEVQGVIEDVDDLSDDVTSLTTRMGTAESNISSQGTRLTTAENEIDYALSRNNNKKVILLADSYGMRNNVTWTSIISQRMDVAYEVSVSSRGFTTADNTFEDGLDACIQNVPNATKPLITDIIVGGGWNDARELAEGRATTTSINNAINSFLAKAKTNFPNAVVHIAYLAWTTKDATQYVGSTYQKQAMKCYNLPRANSHPIINANCPLYDSNNFDETGFHPSNTGAVPLANSIMLGMGGAAQYLESIPYSHNNMTWSFGDNPNVDWILVFDNNQITVKPASSMNISNATAVAGQNTLFEYDAKKFPAFDTPFFMFGVFDGTIGANSYVGLSVLIYVNTTSKLIRLISPVSGAMSGSLYFQWSGRIYRP